MVKNLKYLRTRYGISQQQLAEIAGVSQQSVNKYENHNIEPSAKREQNLEKFITPRGACAVQHRQIY